MHVTVSTTNTVFSVCVACKKVPENFAEIKDVSFLLRRMFLGCGSYCWSIFERLECKITWRKEILLSALGCNAEHVVVPLTLNSLPGFPLLISAFFICLYFWSDVVFFSWDNTNDDSSVREIQIFGSDQCPLSIMKYYQKICVHLLPLIFHVVTCLLCLSLTYFQAFLVWAHVLLARWYSSFQMSLLNCLLWAYNACILPEKWSLNALQKKQNLQTQLCIFAVQCLAVVERKLSEDVGFAAGKSVSWWILLGFEWL